MPNSQRDAFTRINNAALLTNPEPTEAQKISGEYPKGTASVHGLLISIENARSSQRSGTGDGGKQWRNLMPDHYGEIRGTIGADGDAVDVWIGPWPESKRVFVVNQLFVSGPDKGQFDEHKFMLCYPSQDMARKAYENAYERGFQGFGGMVEMTLEQLYWWLRYGAKDKPISLDVLPPVGLELAMSPTLDSIIPYTRWADANPTTQTLDALVYQIRRSDAQEGLMLDSATMAELVDGHEVAALDALIVPVSTLSMKMEAMRKVMDMAGNAVKTVSVQISDPVKRAGSTNVAVLFELSDGQTVTIWFHNPDTTPAKLAPMDDLISWKWLLNKKDVTIVVAPERGQDLNVREVSRRIMRLAEKNSAAFQKANVNRAAKLAEIEALKGEISVAEKTLAELQDRVAAKALEPAAKFDPLSVAGYEQVMKDPALQLKYQDQLDAKLSNRVGDILGALEGLGWVQHSISGASYYYEKQGIRADTVIKHAGAGRNVVGFSLKLSDGTEYIDNLAQTPEEFAQYVDSMTTFEKPAAAPEKVATYEQGRINSKTGRWNRDGYLYAYSTAEDQAYRWVSETSVQREFTGTANGAMTWLGEVLAGMGDTKSLDALQVLSRLKFVSGDDLLAAVATPAAEPAKLSLVEWEGEVIRIMEEDGEGMTNSDAQGVYMVQESKAEDAYRQGKTPAEGAEIVLNASLVPAPSVVAETTTSPEPAAVFPASEVPDDVRTGVGGKAIAAWNKGLTEGNTHNEKFSTAMWSMLMDGLGFRGYQSVENAYRRIIDDLVGGKFPDGLTFADGVQRIRKIATDLAMEVASVTPVEPKRPPMSEGQANGASLKVSDQLDELKRGADFGMLQIEGALFINPDMTLSNAYDGAKKALEAARQEYFDLATKFEKDATSKADQEKQDEYTPFDASQVKLPTAVQLGANKPNTFTVFEGNDSAWSNGHIIDTSRPSSIQKALDEFIGGGKEPNGKSAKSLRKMPAAAIEKVIGNAKGATTKVEPIAFNDFEGTGPVTTGKDSMKLVKHKSVILADESRSISVAVDVLYFGYFYKAYKGCEFFASDSANSAVVVKKAGETIGLIMPKKVHSSAEMLKYSANAMQKDSKVSSPALTEDDQASIDKVDAAYQFSDATNEFKIAVADSVEANGYSPFLTAKTMDAAAQAHGMAVAWSMASDGAAALDAANVDPGAVCDPDEDGDGAFDACAEFDAMPAMSEEGEMA